jgi:hypothetical protein
MDLKVVVAMELLAENLTDVLDDKELFNGCRADDAVLKPTIGALDLELSLWRK